MVLKPARSHWSADQAPRHPSPRERGRPNPTLATLGPAEAAAPRRLRIVHLFRAPVGGLFRHVQDLINAQVDAGHAVGLVCDASGGPRAETALAALAPRLELGISRWRIPREPGISDLGLIGRVLALSRRLRPDVLHGHGAKGGFAARLPASLGVKGRIVTAYTPHGGSLYFNRGVRGHHSYMAAEQFLVRGTDVFTFESQFAADRFAQTMDPRDRLVRVIRNGAHEREFAPVRLDADAADLLYLGEFRRVKGLDVLIDALALLRERHGRETSLRMVGAGPDEGFVRQRIAAHGLREVRLEPPMTAREALRRGKVLVLPSRAESLPYVLIEAAAAGIPIVATDVGGVSEIMAPFAFALVPSDDAPALADAIEARIEEPSSLRSFSTGAIQRHIREHLSVPRMADEIEQSYRDAMQKRGLV